MMVCKYSCMNLSYISTWYNQLQLKQRPLNVRMSSMLIRSPTWVSHHMYIEWIRIPQAGLLIFCIKKCAYEGQVVGKGGGVECEKVWVFWLWVDRFHNEETMWNRDPRSLQQRVLLRNAQFWATTAFQSPVVDTDEPSHKTQNNPISALWDAMKNRDKIELWWCLVLGLR